MATSSQFIANRQNAALSTGPCTPEGKQASARNAIQHGLSSAFSVLPDENQEQFESLHAAFRAEFEPKTPHEEFLVEQMVQAQWRLARVHRLEAAVFEQMSQSGAGDSPDARVAAALIQNSGLSALNVLQRYYGAAERSYYKAVRELTAARQNNAVDNAVRTLDTCIGRIASAPLPSEPAYPRTPRLQNEPKSASLKSNIQFAGPRDIPRTAPAPVDNPALRL